MDQQGAVRQVHVVNIGPDTDAASTLFQTSSSVAQEGASTGETSLRGLPLAPSAASTTAGRSSRQKKRKDSGLRITLELTIAVSQIIASIIVLSLSQDERPQAPLKAWVIGYAAGCLATLPLLYWRYAHRYVRSREQNALPQAASSPATPTSGSSNNARHSRTGVVVERLRIVLDCYFGIWFVLGNVWMFRGHTSAYDAPNLYRLCIVFLTFSYIGYALRFMQCAAVCCCLPCILALHRLRKAANRPRGASVVAITALPTYKVKAIASGHTEGSKDKSKSDAESVEEGGVVAADASCSPHHPLPCSRNASF